MSRDVTGVCEGCGERLEEEMWGDASDGDFWYCSDCFEELVEEDLNKQALSNERD